MLTARFTRWISVILLSGFWIFSIVHIQEENQIVADQRAVAKKCLSNTLKFGSKDMLEKGQFVRSRDFFSEIVKIREDVSSMLVIYDGKTVFQHTSTNPVDEAKVKLGKNRYIIIGFTIVPDALDRHTSDFIIGSIVIFLLAGAATITLIRVLLIKRIQTLIDVAENIKDGEFTTIEVQGSDELAILADSINDMAISQKEYQDDLHSALLKAQKSNELKAMNSLLKGEMKQKHEAELELKKAYEAILASQEQLGKAERLADLGKLVAGVAHEVNTPIGIGVTMVSHLQDLTGKVNLEMKANTLSKSELTEYLDRVGSSSDITLRALTDAVAILKSFKMVSSDRYNQDVREFNVNSYIANILLSLKHTLKPNLHSVTVDCDEDLVISSYPGVISQILTNFINNSLSHGFVNKTQGSILITVEDLGEELELTYKDNGNGIPEKEMKHIFDPFFTTKRQEGGTGLGLHIVHNLVHNVLKGTIRCFDEGGLAFVIKFPKEKSNAAIG